MLKPRQARLTRPKREKKKIRSQARLRVGMPAFARSRYFFLSPDVLPMPQITRFACRRENFCADRKTAPVSSFETEAEAHRQANSSP